MTPLFIDSLSLSGIAILPCFSPVYCQTNAFVLPLPCEAEAEAAEAAGGQRQRETHPHAARTGRRHSFAPKNTQIREVAAQKKRTLWALGHCEEEVVFSKASYIVLECCRRGHGCWSLASDVGQCKLGMRYVFDPLQQLGMPQTELRCMGTSLEGLAG